MLALEVALAGTSPVPTFVFDEVDSGVGGKAAVEVGRRLAALAAIGAGPGRHPPAPGRGVRRPPRRGREGQRRVGDDLRADRCSTPLGASASCRGCSPAWRSPRPRWPTPASCSRPPADASRSERADAPGSAPAGSCRSGWHDDASGEAQDTTPGRTPRASPAPPAPTVVRRRSSRATRPVTWPCSTRWTSTVRPPTRWSRPGWSAVLNRAEMISGRFPNRGPQILVDAGIPMVDQARRPPAGATRCRWSADGRRVVLRGARCWSASRWSPRGGR